MISKTFIALLGLVGLLLTACNLNSASQLATATTAPQPIVSATPPLVVTATPAATATIAPRPTTQQIPPTSVVILPPTIVNCTVRTDWYQYSVAPGDTLFRIGQRSGATVGQLVQANCLPNADRIEVGQIIYVPNPVGGPPTAAPATAVPPTAVPGTPVQFYLIVPNDNGASGTPVGCQDSVIAVNTQQARSGVVQNDIKAALDALFAVDNENYGQSGFVNSLFNSPLTTQSVNITGSRALVNINGSVLLSGVCNDARQEAQLLHTIFQYSGFDDAQIFIGGQNMKQVFDASGLVGADAVYTRAEV